MKKFYLCALLALVSAVQGWAFDFEVDGIYFTITGSNTVSVDKGAYDYEGDITIPKTVSSGGKTYNVTAIADNAFQSMKVENVVLPEGLTTIGNSSFQSSTLKSITLPSTLSSMGTSAFRECKSLTAIALPDALKEIKNGAFYNCSNLKTMTLGQNTTVIEADAFRKTAITNVFIPKSVKTIANGSFCENSAMKSLVIDDAAVFIDYDAFYKCTGLETVDFGNAVTGFGYINSYGAIYGSFRECTSLTKVVIPASVTELRGAFYNCSRLYDVTLPEGLTTIGEFVFQGCAIKDLTIPASVSKIGNNAFSGCPLSKVTFSAPSSLANIGDYAFKDCPLTSIAFPSTLTTIGQYAFQYSALTEVTIPQSVTDINACAFMGCNSLTKVKVENAPVIMTAAFCMSRALTDVDLGNAVVKLSYYNYGSFEGCTSLKSIKLPNTTDVGAHCFKDCTALESVTLPNTLQTIGSNAFMGCRLLKGISLPNTLQTIEGHAFEGCSGLQAISLPTSLKTIQDYGFNGCTSLKDILIPEGLTSLGNNAFSGNSALESVVFDNTVVAIPNNVFQNCTNLKNVELGKVTSIGNNAFQTCTSLESIVIPNSVESLGCAFMGCSSLKNVVIGTGLKSIGGSLYYSQGLFWNCTKLTSVEIKSNVLTSVGECCFYNCRSLKKIELPASVTSIGQRAFEGCSVLSNIYMLPTTPPTINANTFSDYNTPTLHAPAEAKTAYTKADNWKNFTTVVAIGSEPKVTTEDYDALENLLIQAQALYNSAVEGTEPGNYRPGAKAALKAVIEDVEARISATMLAEDAADCTELLNTAMNSFRNKQVKNDIQTNNTLAFAGSLKAAIGSEFRLPIEMNNTDEITGVQFDLYLPEGLSLSEDEYGDYNIELSDRTTTRRHSVASRVMADGALRVVVSSTQNATFTGNSGTLLTLVLYPKSSLEAGDYDVDLKNIILTDPQSTRYAAADMKSVITVSNYTMGDVNNDGHIDVADLAGVVRFILDDADASLVFNAADMDGNGVVEINDYAALVIVILNQENSNVKARRSPAQLEQLVSMTDNGNGEIMINLLANRNFTGMQFDLTLPEGVTLMADGIEAESARHGSWSIQRQDGSYRIICASTSNAELREGTVLRLHLEADGDVDGEAVISNVVLSDTQAVRHEAATARAQVNGTTAIAKVSDKGLKYSAAGGALTLIAGQEQTVRIVSMNGMTVSEVQLAAGQQTTVNLPAGIYLVNNKKVFVRK